MPPKHLRTDLYGNVQPDLFKKVKRKQIPYIESEWVVDYKMSRDRVIWKLPGISVETINELKEKYNLI